MKLQRTVPWGRDLNEYSEMFSLSSLKAGDTVLGCGDGPASFNAEATARGICVTSVDPIFDFSKAELEQRIEEARDEVMPQVRASVSAGVKVRIYAAELILICAQLRPMIEIWANYPVSGTR